MDQTPSDLACDPDINCFMLRKYLHLAKYNLHAIRHMPSMTAESVL
jgi:hypothetical protein